MKHTEKYLKRKKLGWGKFSYEEMRILKAKITEDFGGWYEDHLEETVQYAFGQFGGFFINENNKLIKKLLGPTIGDAKPIFQQVNIYPNFQTGAFISRWKGTEAQLEKFILEPAQNVINQLSKKERFIWSFGTTTQKKEVIKNLFEKMVLTEFARQHDFEQTVEQIAKVLSKDLNRLEWEENHRFLQRAKQYGFDRTE